MYNALSLAFCGTEHLSVVIRLLTTYALVEHRTAMVDALSHIYFNGNYEQHIQALTETMHKAIHFGVWETDMHLFSLSLLLNRPIFSYNTFYTIRQSVRILNLPDTIDPHPFSTKVLIMRPRTLCLAVTCSECPFPLEILPHFLFHRSVYLT